MEIILRYLESMFEQLPKDPSVDRAKEEMASIMEDKYLQLKAEGKSENEAIGIVISEFGNMEEIISALGLKGEKIEQQEKKTERKGADSKVDIPEESSFRTVSLQQAKEYLEKSKHHINMIAIGVVLILLSVLGPINMEVFMGGRTAETLGVVILFLAIAAAVPLFVVNGMALARYDYLQKENLRLEPAVKTAVKHMQEEARDACITKIALGIALCILSVIPVIVMDSVAGQDPRLSEGVGLSCLFTMIAAGVYLLITSGTEYSRYHILLQEGGFSPQGKKNNKVVERVASVYWPIIASIYLAYSLPTDNWERSWIIWPVAGLLFGAFSAFVSSKNKKDS